MNYIKKYVFAAFPFVSVVSLWLAFWCWDFGFVGNEAAAERGQFGDKFGTLNALFTGLALAGIFLTYRQQWRAQRRQDEHFFQASYLNALVGRIEHYSTQIGHYGEDPATKGKLVGEQDELLHELSDALALYRTAAGANVVTRAEINRRHAERMRKTRDAMKKWIQEDK